MSLSALLWTSVAASLQLGGTSTCPSPAEVSARIERLAPEVLEAGAPLTARLDQVEDGVRLELRGADGALLGERLLAGPDQCDARAEAATAILVSWTLQAQQELAGTPPVPAPTGPTPEHRPQRLSLATFDVEGGILGAVDGQSAAVGGMLSASLAQARGRFGASLGLWALGSHTARDTTGTWERFALSLGPLFRTDLGPTLHLDVQADACVALLTLFPEAGDSSAAIDPGASAGVRVISEHGFWAGVRGIGWPLVHRFPGGEVLPRWDAVLTLGLVWWDP